MRHALREQLRGMVSRQQDAQLEERQRISCVLTPDPQNVGITQPELIHRHVSSTALIIFLYFLHFLGVFTRNTGLWHAAGLVQGESLIKEGARCGDFLLLV